jgi:glycosyltransferase involved in cell wall biosynthesis
MRVENNTSASGVVDTKGISSLPGYPIEMSVYLNLPHCAFNGAGIPFQVGSYGYNPTTIIYYALAHWNLYLATNNEDSLNIFLKQARWLVEHEVIIDEDASGWPLSFTHPDVATNGYWLSALTQGCGISVLVRACKLTGDNTYLKVAHRIIGTFTRDILDGGVSTPVAKEGIFFEEVAIYPAAHMLNGFMFALLGLYDYIMLTDNTQIAELIRHALATMHSLLDEFDLGFWIRSDLLRGRLASPTQFGLQIELLSVLAKFSGCGHCLKLALRWKRYRGSLVARVRYIIVSGFTSCYYAMLERARSVLFPVSHSSQRVRVCVPLPSHPFTGGILTVLDGVAQVTKDIWEMEYLVQFVGPNAEKFNIHRFSTPKMGPWYFPIVWIYCIAGFLKLVSLRRHGVNYQVLLPQDGVFTAAFTAVAGKLIGARVVCIDHSTLTWATNRHYRTQRVNLLETRRWPRALRVLVRLLLRGYWPSLALLSHISKHFVDHYLLPGVTGDEIEKVCDNLRIPQSRITRFASLIDVNTHSILDAPSGARMRKQKGIPVNAIVIAIICRLAPEKGLDIAVESIDSALSELSSELRGRVRVIVAGDGPLRTQIEEEIRMRRLDKTCEMWGEISAQEVSSLLAVSDIFLYTSVRGACMAMSVLEAMASGCAVIASTEPLSNAVLLDDERGITVPPGDVKQTSKAIVRLINNLELCHKMGVKARNYVSVYNSPAEFRRTLLRATYWSGLDEFLQINSKNQGIVPERSLYVRP